MHFQQSLQVISNETRWFLNMPRPISLGIFAPTVVGLKKLFSKMNAALVCFSIFVHSNNTKKKEALSSVSTPALHSFVLTENHAIRLFRAHCE